MLAPTDIAGDGAAEALAPLLTGYEFLPFAPFEEVTKRRRDGEVDGRRRFPADSALARGRHHDGGDVRRVASRLDACPGRGWRAVAARAASPDAAEAHRGPTRRRTSRRDRRRRRRRRRGGRAPAPAQVRVPGIRRPVFRLRARAGRPDRRGAPPTARACPWAVSPTRGLGETAGGHPRVLLAARTRLASGAPARRGGDATDASADDRVDASRAALSDEERVRDLARSRSA